MSSLSFVFFTGMNTREVRFNLHGSLQESGLDVGQFVALRGELDGETLMGYFSPITRPNDEGVIGILCRVDAKGGPITSLLENARPGTCLHTSAMGGLRLKFLKECIRFRGKEIKRIGLLAGGTSSFVFSFTRIARLPLLPLTLVSDFVDL